VVRVSKHPEIGQHAGRENPAGGSTLLHFEHLATPSRRFANIGRLFGQMCVKLRKTKTLPGSIASSCCNFFGAWPSYFLWLLCAPFARSFILETKKLRKTKGKEIDEKKHKNKAKKKTKGSGWKVQWQLQLITTGGHYQVPLDSSNKIRNT